MVHTRTALVLATALLITSHVGAATDPQLVAFLKTRPTDRTRVVGQLKRYLTAHDYENAYLVARYVAKYLDDHSARLYEVLALCALHQNQTDKAREFAAEVLRADPTNARARRIIAKLEPAKGAGGALSSEPDSAAAGFIAQSPAPSPAQPEPAAPTAGRAAPVSQAAVAPVTSPAVASLALSPVAVADDAPLLASIRQVPLGKLEEARRAFWEDRYDFALKSVNGYLSTSPRDFDALLLKAKVQAARTEYKEAATILHDLATRERPRGPEVYLALANMARDLAGVTNQESELKTAQDHYRNALAVDGEHVPTLLSYASFLYQLNQPELADPLYKRACRHLPFKGRDAEKYAAAAVRKARGLSWEQWGGRLHAYLAMLERAVWPELIVIGGGVSAKHRKFFPYLKTRARLVPAEFLNEAGIVGAALWAVAER